MLGSSAISQHHHRHHHVSVPSALYSLVLTRHPCLSSLSSAAAVPFDNSTAASTREKAWADSHPHPVTISNPRSPRQAPRQNLQFLFHPPPVHRHLHNCTLPHSRCTLHRPALPGSIQPLERLSARSSRLVGTAIPPCRKTQSPLTQFHHHYYPPQCPLKPSTYAPPPPSPHPLPHPANPPPPRRSSATPPSASASSTACATTAPSSRKRRPTTPPRSTTARRS